MTQLQHQKVRRPQSKQPGAQGVKKKGSAKGRGGRKKKRAQFTARAVILSLATQVLARAKELRQAKDLTELARALVPQAAAKWLKEARAIRDRVKAVRKDSLPTMPQAGLHAHSTSSVSDEAGVPAAGLSVTPPHYEHGGAHSPENRAAGDAG